MNDDIISDMNYKVNLAESQYRIDQAKNGSKKEEEVKIQLDNLRAQKDSLVQQLDESKETIKKSIQDARFHQEEHRLSSKAATNNQFKYDELVKSIFENKVMNNILNQYTPDEINNFINFATRRKEGKPASLTSHYYDIFYKNGLIVTTQSDGVILTTFGYLAYNYIENLKD